MSSNKPNSSNDVFEIMKDYCDRKEFVFSVSQLKYMAEDCYLFFESRGWSGVKYWPAIAMRWVLNNLKNQSKDTYKHKHRSNKGKSVRDIILEHELKQENE